MSSEEEMELDSEELFQSEEGYGWFDVRLDAIERQMTLMEARILQKIHRTTEDHAEELRRGRETIRYITQLYEDIKSDVREVESMIVNQLYEFEDRMERTVFKKIEASRNGLYMRLVLEHVNSMNAAIAERKKLERRRQEIINMAVVDE